MKRSPQWLRRFTLFAVLSRAALAATIAVSPAAAAQRAESVVVGVLISEKSGAPLAGALVGYAPWMSAEAEREAIAAGRFEPRIRGEVATDTRGRFTLEITEGHPVYLTARAAGHARSGISLQIVSAGKIDLGVVRLPEGRDLHGRLLGPDGAPLVKARVYAVSTRPHVWIGEFTGWPLTHEAVTADDGTFLLDGLGRPGVYVGVAAAGMALVPASSEKGAGGLEVKAQKAMRLTGRVVGPDGETPVPGAWVRMEGALVDFARADAEGRFELGRLGPGKARVTAVTSQAAEGPAAFLAPSESKDVEPGVAGPLILPLRQGGRLKARVIDDLTGSAVPGAMVAGIELDGMGLLSDASGGASAAGLPAGRASGRFRARGYAESRPLEFRIEPAREAAATIRLQRGASVEGRVVDAAGAPVAGARLFAGAPSSFDTGFIGSLGREACDSGITRTGDDGVFRIEGLPPATHVQIQASRAGFAMARWDVVSLEAGERRRDVEVVLSRGLSIRGRVVGPEGASISGASVFAQPSGSRDSSLAADRPVDLEKVEFRRSMGESSLLPVTTDAEGRYRLVDAGPGTWTVVVRADGYVPRVVTGLPVSEPDGADASEIALEPAVRVRGTLTDARGGLVPRAYLSLADPAGRWRDWSVELRDDGTFESVGLPAGRELTLEVKADGYLPFKLPGLTPPVDGLAVKLTRGLTLGGRVLDSVSGSPVTDFDLEHGARSSDGDERKPGETDDYEFIRSETGEFSLEGVRPGPIFLSVRADGYRPKTLNDLVLSESAPRRDLVIPLDRAVEVVGTVVDEDGRPLPDVSVEAAPAGLSSRGLGAQLREGRDSVGATTDSSGVFRLELQSTAPVRVSFRSDRHEAFGIDVDPAEQRDDLRITLRPGIRLNGRVQRAKDGAPVAGAQIVAWGEADPQTGGRLSTRTEQDGSFRLEGLGHGAYQVIASAAGLRRSEPERFVVTEGALLPPLTITLVPGVRLTGVVQGMPPDRLQSLGVSPAGSIALKDRARVGSDGRFVLEGLPDGEVTLALIDESTFKAVTTRVVTIPEGVETWDVTIDLGKGATVSGVVTQEGKPVSDVVVLFTPSSGRSQSAVPTGSDGAFAAQGLEADTYVVMAVLEGTRIHMVGQMAIEQDRTLDIELPAERIQGTVVSAASGEPIARAEVVTEILDPGVPIESRLGQAMGGVVTDDEGRFRIEGLAPGPYRVTVRAPGFGFEARETTVSPGVPSTLRIGLSGASESLRIRALSSAGGAPLAGQGLALLYKPGLRDPLGASGAGDQGVFQGMLSLDSEGRAAIDSLQTGRYRGVIMHVDGSSVSFEVTLPAQELTLVLRQGTLVSVDAAGLPEGSIARAIVLDAAGQPVYMQPIVADPVIPMPAGRVGALAGMQPGNYLLRASLPDGRVIEKPFVVLEGQPVTLTLP